MWRVVLLLAGPLCVVGYNNGAPHSRLPPLGWSSWVALGPGDQHPIFDYCDEASVKAAADAMHTTGLYDAGYRHFHLDDCWAGGRNKTGYLYAQENHFPKGIKETIDYIHSKGLVFGLYTCGGNYTCVGHRPGSNGHWKQDADVFAEWGVDWVKMDWCNHGHMDPKDTYPLMSHALNASGRHIHFNMCEWGNEDPWEWGDAIAQSWRMSGDHTPIWSSTKKQIQLSAAIPAKYSGQAYGWNDMDMLETGNYAQAAHANGREGNMTATEYHTEFSMWAISASPLVVTTPITKGLTDLQKAILLNKEVVAINQDVTPQGRPLKDGDLTRWGRRLSDHSWGVALYNEDDSSLSTYLDFTLLGWTSSQKAIVRDLWAKKTLGTFTGRYPANGTVEVEPHAAVLLRVTPA